MKHYWYKRVTPNSYAITDVCNSNRIYRDETGQARKFPSEEQARFSAYMMNLGYINGLLNSLDYFILGLMIDIPASRKALLKQRKDLIAEMTAIYGHKLINKVLRDIRQE